MLIRGRIGSIKKNIRIKGLFTMDFKMFLGNTISYSMSDEK